MYSRKKIARVTYPIFLTLLAQTVINVTDTAFLGRVSEVALGASAIGGVFYIAVYMVGYGFSQGAQILIGRRNGEKNYSAIGPIFNSGMLASFLISVLIFLICLQWMPALMKGMVSSQEIYLATMEFLDWRIYGFFFAFINVMFRALFVGITRTRVLTISAFITAGTNIFLDWVLIFGKLSFPELGIAGAAIASVIAEAVTTAYLLLVTLRQHDRKKLGLLYVGQLNLKHIWGILDLSVFIMFQYFIGVATWFIFFIFIEKLGERPLAITNIGRSLYSVLMIPGAALATTVNTMVSNMIGAGQKENVIHFMHKNIRLTLWVVLPMMVVAFVYPALLAHIYTDDISLVSASLGTIRIVSVAMIFNSVTSIIFSAVIGSGNTRTAFAIEMFSLVFYVFYIYYTAIVLAASVEVIWLSEFVYWFIIGGLGYLYMLKGDWRRREI